jgi:hypothetical protein
MEMTARSMSELPERELVEGEDTTDYQHEIDYSRKNWAFDRGV